MARRNKNEGNIKNWGELTKLLEKKLEKILLKSNKETKRQIADSHRRNQKAIEELKAQWKKENEVNKSELLQFSKEQALIITEAVSDIIQRKGQEFAAGMESERLDLVKGFAGEVDPLKSSVTILKHKVAALEKRTTVAVS